MLRTEQLSNRKKRRDKEKIRKTNTTEEPVGTISQNYHQQTLTLVIIPNRYKQQEWLQLMREKYIYTSALKFLTRTRRLKA